MVCFSHVSWKLEYFPICSFNSERWKHHWYFYLNRFYLVLHFSLTTFSSEYLLTCKERKRSSDPCKFSEDQYTLQSDWTGGLAVINFELKMHGKPLFTLFFILCHFQWQSNSEHHTLWQTCLKFFFSSGYLSTYKKSMWSSHSIRTYVWSKNPAI